ncbi:MAG: nucleotidyltransferase family protein [Spirochaetes bacterium]|nr:nucleotidyltransferase family protein [Spirochaetota bacterium]
MKNINELKKLLSTKKEKIQKEYNVKEIGIFGSYVRGEEKKDSDIDVLVEFDEPIGFFKFLELEEYLEELFGIKVDLVSKKALKPVIGKYIKKEVTFI